MYVRTMWSTPHIRSDISRIRILPRKKTDPDPSETVHKWIRNQANIYFSMLSFAYLFHFQEENASSDAYEQECQVTKPLSPLQSCRLRTGFRHLFPLQSCRSRYNCAVMFLKGFFFVSASDSSGVRTRVLKSGTWTAALEWRRRLRYLAFTVICT